jgi:two-component system chemotaxis response regulator CheB
MNADPFSKKVIVVGASAGGVEALTGLLANFPAGLAAAVFVVLHIPPETPSLLAPILARICALPVKPAVDREAIVAGQVYVATADRHLLIEGNQVRITRGPREGRARPSIDALFRSASVVHGERVIGIVLSGALDDGTAGAWAIKDRGGVVLVQEPAQAMHDSMPESVIRHVSVDRVGTVQQLAVIVASLVGSPAQGLAAPAGSDENLKVETLIAMEGDGLKAGVMELGKISKYTCPDCHGVLVQIEEGSIVRFRCHTGHAFSLMTLLAEVNESIDTGLWDTLRAIEERVMLLRQMERLARDADSVADADRCKSQADETERRLKPLRELVLDPKFFGHDQQA